MAEKIKAVVNKAERNSDPDSLFIDPFTDFGIKRIFGAENSKSLLIDLVNAIRKGYAIIHEVTYNNNERPGPRATNRKTVLDIFFETDLHELINLEFQRRKQAFIKERTLFYSSALLYEQGIKGEEWRFNLKPVTTICFTAFEFDKEHPFQVLHPAYYIDTANGDIFDKHLSSNYLELPKFKKQEHELKTRLDIWLYVLINLVKFRKIPLFLRGDKVFEKLFEIAKLANLNTKEMTAYQLDLKEARDYNNTLSYARYEGEMEGERKAKIDNATNLIKEGVALDIIYRSTGISLKKLLAIRKKIEKSL